MAGLLDYQFPQPTPMDDPRTVGLLKLATGLLQAGGPSARPVGFGQALGAAGGEAIGAYQAQRQQQQKDQMEQLQTRAALLKLQKEMDMQDFFNSLLKGGAPAASGGMNVSRIGPDGRQVGPMVGGAPTPSAAPSSGLPGGIDPRAAGMAYMLGGQKELAGKILDRTLPDMQVSNGYAYDKNKLPTGFLPGVHTSSSGQTSVTLPDGNGGIRVGAPTGALETYGAYANADAAAKAAYDPMTITPPGGQPVMTTRGKVVSQIGAPGFPRVTPEQQAGRDEERKRLIRDELKANPNDPALRQEASRLGIPLQSEEEKQRTTAQVEVDKARALAQQQKGQGQDNALVILEEINNRLRDKNLVLGNDPASRAAMLGHEWGLQSRATINTTRIRELGNQLTLANGSLGTAVSDADRKTYEAAQGRFAQAKGYEDMLDAVQTMVRIARKYIAKDEQTQNMLRNGKRSVISSGGWSATEVKP